MSGGFCGRHEDDHRDGCPEEGPSHLVTAPIKCGEKDEIEHRIQEQPKPIPRDGGVQPDGVVGNLQGIPQKGKGDGEEQLKELKGNHEQAFPQHALPFGHRQNGCVPEVVGFPRVHKGDVRRQTAEQKDDAVRIGRHQDETAQKGEHDGGRMGGKPQFFIE